MTRAKSEELFRRAQAVIPGGVNSPVRAFRSVGGNPVFIARGEGSHVFDVDGNVPWGMQTTVLDAAKGNNVHSIFYMPRTRR